MGDDGTTASSTSSANPRWVVKVFQRIKSPRRPTAAEKGKGRAVSSVENSHSQGTFSIRRRPTAAEKGKQKAVSFAEPSQNQSATFERMQPPQMINRNVQGQGVNHDQGVNMGPVAGPSRADPMLHVSLEKQIGYKEMAS